jgi:hypothetical protein
MELSNQLPGSHPLTAPIHPPERVTGPPELHHSEGRYPELSEECFGQEVVMCLLEGVFVTLCANSR